MKITWRYADALISKLIPAEEWENTFPDERKTQNLWLSQRSNETCKAMLVSFEIDPEGNIAVIENNLFISLHGFVNLPRFVKSSVKKIFLRI